MADGSTADRSPTGDRHRESVERAVAAMRERLGEELTLAELARVARMSPFHFVRVFKGLTGIPPSQFLHALRLERARRLLVTTGRSVTDICFEVGYGSLGTFTSRFTRLVGLAPGRLRQLAETFAPASPRRLLETFGAAPRRPGPAIRGRIATARAGGLVFAGLFPRAIPQERPLACTILAGPGEYALAAPGDGRYFVFAVQLARPRRSLDLVLGGEKVRGVAAAGPIVVAGGRPVTGADLRLRPPGLLDPPLLLTLPVLLARGGGAAASTGLAAPAPASA